jgi:putative endonuclease
LRLIERNYRSPHGEIDLIMSEDPMLIFVEVRFRRNEKFGLAAETVDRNKQRKLHACAEHYLLHNKRLSNRPCRFDVVTLTGDPATGELRWYADAFQ